MSEKKKKVFRGSHGSTSDPDDKHVILSEDQSSTHGFLKVKDFRTNRYIFSKNGA
jgi:hypothetical protein